MNGMGPSPTAKLTTNIRMHTIERYDKIGIDFCKAKKTVSNTKSTIITIMGKTSNGLRPNRSINGMHTNVAKMLTKPVRKMAYCIRSLGMPASLNMPAE